MTIDDAEKKAKYMMPTGVNTEMSGRCMTLYNSFVKMQEEECKNSHDVNYYASRLNVSPRYLSQVTRRVASQSPKSIIDSSLLGKIKELLKTDKTIQEIAYQLEFSSQAHLSNFFKRFTGTSPSDYRKLIVNG
jgi:hydroxymethylpyrimidine/phosphomethylpyrimidine kinase